MTTPPKRVKLLSLDGGGVKGICTLVILDALMDEIKAQGGGFREWDDKPRPVDCFDLAGGTSSGGLVALLLFRLDMTTTAAIETFKSVARETFTPWIGGINLHDFGVAGYHVGNPFLQAKALFAPSRFPGEPLVRAIDRAMEAHGYENKGGTKLMKEGSGKM